MPLTLEQAWPVPTKADVNDAVRRLVDAFDPLRVIVFGSYARGEARSGSDLDLLVVMPRIDDKRKAAIAMRKALAGTRIGKDIVVTTPDEISKRQDSTWHIVGLALQEGKTVYLKPDE